MTRTGTWRRATLADDWDTPAETWGAALEGWRDPAATQVSFNTMNAGLKSPRDHIDAIRRFCEAGTPG